MYLGHNDYMFSIRFDVIDTKKFSEYLFLYISM